MEEEEEEDQCTVGGYLARRLEQVGIQHVFAVAGDYNLALLDELLSSETVEQVYCSNELNCGFAAEGYARARGAACAVVTFSVGALSALNALGGAYAEDLPVVLVSGGPNSADLSRGRVLHHTLGTPDLTYQLEMARRVTCAAVAVATPAQAPAAIDFALREALRRQKPVYIEIACNVAGEACPAPGPASAVTRGVPSDGATMAAAVAAAVAWLERAKKPVMLLGPQLRSARAEQVRGRG